MVLGNTHACLCRTQVNALYAFRTDIAGHVYQVQVAGAERAFSRCAEKVRTLTLHKAVQGAVLAGRCAASCD